MKKQGFALIELLVVIAIIGILSAVVMVAINPAERIAQSQDAGLQEGLGQIASALESYYMSRGAVYPTASQGFGALTGGGFLKHLPQGTYLYTVAPSGCDNLVVKCSEAAISSDLAARSNPDWWVYRTACGGAAGDTAAATVATIGDCP